MEFLLVDDNEITLEIEKLMLESCGISITTVNSGEEAIKLAAEKSFFMIFMDINMPGMNGFEAAEIIRKNDRNVLIVALSADAISIDDPRYIKSGMNGTLLKPLQLSDLKELLGHFIEIKTEKKDFNNDINDIFNYDGFLHVIKEKKAVFRLIEQFLNVHGDDCDKLNEFIGKGELISAREILHNVIGISGNLFCRRLYRISRDLSNELKLKISDSLDEFNRTWDETVRVLREYLDKLSEIEETPDSSTNWDSLREDFNVLCKEFDVYAAELFIENINVFKKKMKSERFEELKAAISSYDFLWISDNMEVLYV